VNTCHCQAHTFQFAYQMTYEIYEECCAMKLGVCLRKTATETST
jgi:hypothetical protein